MNLALARFMLEIVGGWVGGWWVCGGDVLFVWCGGSDVLGMWYGHAGD